MPELQASATETLTPIAYAVWTYAVYVVLSLGLTVWVGRTLHKNGRIFLVDAFHGREALADSVNHLLLVGFYLINIGYVSLALRLAQQPLNVQMAIEFLSGKVGNVLLVLGAMHFGNLYVFSRLRRSGLLEAAPPPVPPSERLAEQE
jgi:hypothetical protein